MTATDLDTMRRAVLLDPADDLARLALADACEEAGELGRAEFVRQGVGRPDLRYTVHAGQAIGIGFPKVYAAHTVRCPDGCASAVVRRGLVESVALPLAAFMRHAKELFGRHPITAVTLTDREPNDVSTAERGVLYAWLCWRWSYMEAELIPGGSSTPYDVPQELLSHSPYKWLYFDTTELARAALDAACVAYGRREAGLPPLPVHPPADTGRHAR